MKTETAAGVTTAATMILIEAVQRRGAADVADVFVVVEFAVSVSRR
jgi:hypothetical protein